jgi:hypothetical protein
MAAIHTRMMLPVQNEYLVKSSGIQYRGNYLATITTFSPDNPP